MTHRPTLAVLGGGQLGRMLGLAAIPLGVQCRFLDPSPTAGAAAVGELVVGALDDLDAIAKLVDGADALTYEWEGVPAAALEHAATLGVRVAPGVAALVSSQDRGTEKAQFAALGIPTAPYRLVGSFDDLVAAAGALGYPSILKTCRGGYDGKGQVRIESSADLEVAWQTLGGVPLVLEGFVAFDRELSVIAARGHDGHTVTWPLAQNEHGRGILRVTTAPAPDTDAEITALAHRYATTLLDALAYVGVVCIELFQVGAELLVNEFAPRVHNSGHWTIEGSVTSQFENHVRAVVGLPLGSTAARGRTTMINAIGVLPDPTQLLAVEGVHFHDYAKGPRTGRKVGHVTITDSTPERVAQIRSLVVDDG